VNPVSLAFALVLGCAAILAALLASRARPAARDYLRFAAVLYSALALCEGLEAGLPNAAILVFADAVMLVVSALAPVAMVLALFAAFEHRPSSAVAAILLVPGCLAGIAAAASGTVVLAFAPLAVSVLVMFALCARRWRNEKRAAAHAFLACCCLLCAAAATLSGGVTGRTASALFSSAALLGFALALARRSRVAVAERRDLRSVAAPIGADR
jgi:hypothetical protein